MDRERVYVPVPEKGAIMRLRQSAFIITALLLALGFSGAALANGGHFNGGHFNGGHFHGGHFHHGPRFGFGVFIGPGYWPGYYGYPYYPSPYYYPPVVAVPAAPPTYVEQGDGEGEGASGSAYWYYCTKSKAYYPYVKSCPGGWQRVPAQPADE